MSAISIPKDSECYYNQTIRYTTGQTTNLRFSFGDRNHCQQIDKPIKFTAKNLTSSIRKFSIKSRGTTKKVECDYPLPRNLRAKTIGTSMAEVLGLTVDSEGNITSVENDITINGVFLEAGLVSDENRQKLLTSEGSVHEVSIRIRGNAVINADIIFEKCIGHVTFGKNVQFNGQIRNYG